VPCLPYGNYLFVSQADIDNFQTAFLNCTAIQGNVTISGSDITNLMGLDNLTSIGGNIDIGSNPALTSLTGLENITSIAGGLGISSNDALTSLTGLENVTSIGGHLNIYENYALTSLTGLENVTSIGGGFSIYNNDALTSLTGLEGLTSIGGRLDIGFNDALTSLTGLENITSIARDLGISYNDALTSLTGLENVTSIGGGLFIDDNPVLTRLTGMENIDAGSITDLYVQRNPLLSTCEVKSICDYLVTPNGTVDIHDNATGCNSEEEVKSNCKYGYEDYAASENRINIYPNPAFTTITISTPTTPNKNTFMTIYNISGQALFTRQITEQQTVVDVSGLPLGVYFVRVSNDRTVMVEKFIKN
jgi:hypothetical protein